MGKFNEATITHRANLKSEGKLWFHPFIALENMHIFVQHVILLQNSNTELWTQSFFLKF